MSLKMKKERIKLATLGPKGTFSHEAAVKFCKDCKIVFCSDIEEIFDAVEESRADFGIIPVENSLEGSVALTLELLLERNAEICREIVININHHLLALKGARMGSIKQVFSHPHALAQCRGIIKKLKLGTRNFLSTAEAAKEIASKKLKDSAAIASEMAAKIYGLEIIKKNIQDYSENKTRFFVIARKCGNRKTEAGKKRTGKMKSSIIAGIKDRPGALHDMLGSFAKKGINLTKIESRPSKRKLGDYVFYIDFEGDAEGKKVKDILKELSAAATFVKVLGSYPYGS